MKSKQSVSSAAKIRKPATSKAPVKAVAPVKKPVAKSKGK